MFVPSVTGPVGWKNYRHNWIFHLSRIQRGLRKSCAALRRIARYTPVLKHLLSDINELAVKRSKYKKNGGRGGGALFYHFTTFFFADVTLQVAQMPCSEGSSNAENRRSRRFVYFVEEMPFFVLACQRCQYFERIERCRLMPLFRESRKNLRPPNVPSHGAGGPWFLSFSRIHMQMSFIRPSADDFASCQLCTKRPLYLINSRNSINTSSI